MKFLGYGAAYNPALGNTSAYFEKNEKLFLIDCGETVFSELFKRDILKKYEEIYILITHMHADHVGSLGSLISYSHAVLKKKVVVLYPDAALVAFLDMIGINRKSYTMLLTRETEIDGVSVEAIPVKHADNMGCYGYIISTGEKTIYYSGDSYELPEKILKGLFSGNIDEIFQDTTNKVSAHRSHFPISELSDVIPFEFRKKVFCMHFSCDFSDQIEQLGFNSVKCFVI